MGAEARLVLPDLPPPRVRDDVQLIRGARSWDGEPGWTLHDVVRNQFFQVSETDFHVLSCWDAGTGEQVAQAASSAAGTPVDLDYLDEFARFLMQAELLDAGNVPLRQRLNGVQRSRQQTFWKMLLHKYLFFRVPLIRPDRLLDRLYPRVRFIFTPGFFRLIAFVGVLGLVMLARNWEEFVGTFSWFFSPAGALVFVGTLVFAKILHEFGHALTCKHYGLRVPAMGVAFLVMWPVLYTDGTDAWRLNSRRKRVAIVAAGVITETVLAAIALFAFFLLPEGLFRSVAFTLATTTWFLSLIVNLNPFMRFDGYYLLADSLNIANLQDRSFALAKWKLRGYLFGTDDPCPEALPKRLITFMIWYGWAVWIYRFFLFLGIALLVYHFFFKALGVFLFAVEIWWFILAPVWREIKVWKTLRLGLSASRKRAYLVGGAALFLVLVIPWRSEVEVPALLSADRYQREYPVVPARVVAVHVRDGQAVRAGDVLLELASDSLDFQGRSAGLDLLRLQGTLSRQALNTEFRDRLVLEQERAKADELVQGIDRARSRLVVRAGFDGTVRDLDPDLHPGRWLSTNQPLLTLVGGAGGRVVAWVPEGERDRLRPGQSARFYGDNGFGPQGVRMEVTGVETSSVRTLSPVYQASLFGGAVAVRRDDSGEIIPEQAVYRVHLRPLEPGMEGQEVRVRGVVIIAGERSSLLGSFLELVLATLLRESGL